MNRRDWAVDRADPQPPWGEIYWLRHCRVAAGAGVADAPGDDESAVYDPLEGVTEGERRLATCSILENRMVLAAQCRRRVSW